MVETSTDRKLKAIRSDNGGEYTSVEFSNFLNSGVRHELTVPKSPEQNGVAERLNRTVVEMTRSMLAGSILPQKFWAEAMSTGSVPAESKSHKGGRRNDSSRGISRK